MAHALVVEGMTPQERDAFDDGLEEAGLKLVDDTTVKQARLIELEAERRKSAQAEEARMRATWGLEPDDLAGIRAMEALAGGAAKR